MADETRSVDVRPVDVLEEERVTELRAAQSKAERLFHEVEARGLIRAGITESQLNQEIYDLAKEMYGISYVLAQANCPCRSKHTIALCRESARPHHRGE